MGVKNIDAYTVGVTIRRLQKDGYVDDDGRNYIIRKSVFEAALTEASKNASESPPQRSNGAEPPMTLVELLQEFKRAFNVACGYKYVSEPTDWAKLRHLALKYGPNEIHDRFELFFKTQLDAQTDIGTWEPTIDRLEVFLRKQTKLGNIQEK
jgi:hypothetical protein